MFQVVNKKPQIRLDSWKLFRRLFQIFAKFLTKFAVFLLRNNFNFFERNLLLSSFLLLDIIYGQPHLSEDFLSGIPLLRKIQLNFHSETSISHNCQLLITLRMRLFALPMLFNRQHDFNSEHSVKHERSFYLIVPLTDLRARL